MNFWDPYYDVGGGTLIMRYSTQIMKGTLSC